LDEKEKDRCRLFASLEEEHFYANGETHPTHKLEKKIF
jgi:hypothetical protein